MARLRLNVLVRRVPRCVKHLNSIAQEALLRQNVRIWLFSSCGRSLCSTIDCLPVWRIAFIASRHLVT